MRFYCPEFLEEEEADVFGCQISLAWNHSQACTLCIEPVILSNCHFDEMSIVT